MYSGFLQTSAPELFTKIISHNNIMLFNYSRINFNPWCLTGPECGSADAYNTVLKVQNSDIPLTASKGETSPFEICHLFF